MTSEMMIGKNKYIVTTHYNKKGRETAEDKLMRIVAGRISAAKTGRKPPSAPLAI
jgi:hypothetical protein